MIRTTDQLMRMSTTESLQVWRKQHDPSNNVSAENEQQAEKSLVVDPRTKYVLIVEDNKFAIENLAPKLKKEGVEMVIAENGREAVEKFNEYADA